MTESVFFFLIISTISVSTCCFQLCHCNIQNYYTVCPEIEKEALLSFKKFVEYDSNILSSWKEETNCCMWEGVVCNNLTGHVLQLHLRNSFYDGSGNLQGKLNPCLLNLKHLRYIDLSGNNFTEPIPNFIGSFANLEYLDLSYAGFYGPIPHTLGNLTSLHTLRLGGIRSNVESNIEWLSALSHLEHLNMINVNLSRATNWLQVISNLPSLVELKLSSCSLEHNNFQLAPPLDEVNFTSLAILVLSGNNLGPVVPRWISHLNKLTYLSLDGNLFEGSIPSISNTTKLQYINLSYNNFNSTIPDWICSCKSLQSLYLTGNSLSGPIPINLGNLSSLTDLYLGSNKLTGNLQYSFGQLNKLISLEIENNMLEGIVSESHFANLTNLSDLFASGNHLTLELEPNWIPPFKLRVLELRSWNLVGDHNQILTWLETEKGKLSNLDLSNTGISFHVPSWIWEVTDYLNLSCNQLHGNIPADVIIGTISIDLSSNQFNGSLPRLGKEVYCFDLSNNSFSGGLSHSLCDTATKETYSLVSLHVGGNFLSGEIPEDDDCWMKWQNLVYLNIGSNNMSGSIPNSIGLLANLYSLNLNNNSLSGKIPSSIHNCTFLVKIDLSDNKLVGSIPSLSGISFSKWIILILRSNKLSGEIPTGICQLSFLQILDLSDNIFSGKIPRCISNLTAMATKTTWMAGEMDYYLTARSGVIESTSVATKGTELHYDTILFWVTNIDLSRNHLSGEIPKQITSLVELISLNLSENHFTGHIPDGIGDMKQLESLDLSRNSLSGEIPKSISVLTSLSYMDLSYNNLTGRIPESTQLGSLNASSFIGNKLCGPPLTSGCSNDKDADKVHAPGFYYNKEDGGKKREIDWFYIFLTLGYVVGFSAVCNALIFIKSWRDASFGWMENMWNKLCVYTSRRRC